MSARERGEGTGPAAGVRGGTLKGPSPAEGPGRVGGARGGALVGPEPQRKALISLEVPIALGFILALTFNSEAQGSFV